MYSNVTYCVKIGNTYSDPIPSKIGVKQGCVLSPLLLNLYLSDLPMSIFKDCECDPVVLKLQDFLLNVC
jgi:hypothetical protein